MTWRGIGWQRSHICDCQITQAPVFLLENKFWSCMKVSVAQSCVWLCNPMDCSPPGPSVHGDSPGKNTGVGAISFSRGSSDPGSEPGLPPCRWILHRMSHKGSMRVFDSLQPHGLQPARLFCPWQGIFQGKILEWGCYFLLQGIVPTQGLNPHLFLSSVLAGRFFTTSTPWEAQ